MERKGLGTDGMETREEAIAFCKTLKGAVEDYPFRDHNWTIMRHRSNRKLFACIYERQGHIWVNVKCDPEWRDFWRGAFGSVVPAYHMNKEHWNSIILNGTVPEEEIRRMIGESYRLTEPKQPGRPRQPVRQSKGGGSDGTAGG